MSKYRYLFVDEEGALTTANTIPPEAIKAHEAGIWDIVDMELGLQYCGGANHLWESLDEL